MHQRRAWADSWTHRANTTTTQISIDLVIVLEVPCILLVVAVQQRTSLLEMSRWMNYSTRMRVKLITERSNSSPQAISHG